MRGFTYSYVLLYSVPDDFVYSYPAADRLAVPSTDSADPSILYCPNCCTLLLNLLKYPSLVSAAGAKERDPRRGAVR
jgi:hypothetical protein